ncbi:MAG TPA: hypothetical protein VJU79_05045 [Candidatus Dormibacteraeota bacterium]|nr:hypothetical protein [Candidatus Dormibacteraeota bacterium]
MLDYRTSTSAPAPAEPSEEEDWFGEGNAFESGEDLAAALLAMAYESGTDDAPAAAEPMTLTAPGSDDSFVLVDGRDFVPVPRPSSVNTPPAPMPKRSWAVRAPGSMALPPRAPGRSGWSIRNSVKVLQHTEEILDKLRHEAVVATLMSASRAFHPEKHLPKQPLQAR